MVSSFYFDVINLRESIVHTQGCQVMIFEYEPQHEISNNVVCVTN